jgi:hypothetical protein
MLKRDFIAMLEKEECEEIGIVFGTVDSIATDISIGYVRATKVRKGVRYVADKAKSGLLILAPTGRVPSNF